MMNLRSESRHAGGLVALLAASMLLASCASSIPRGDSYGYRNAPVRHACQRCGVVESVRQTYDNGNDNAAVIGTVIGAVVGAAAGHQVGKGDGRKAATVGGAVAGGVIGHEIGERQGRDRAVWQVRVRLDDGRYATVTQEERPRVRAGDYVEVRDNRVYLR